MWLMASLKPVHRLGYFSGHATQGSKKKRAGTSLSQNFLEKEGVIL